AVGPGLSAGRLRRKAGAPPVRGAARGWQRQGGCRRRRSPRPAGCPHPRVGGFGGLTTKPETRRKNPAGTAANPEPPPDHRKLPPMPRTPILLSLGLAAALVLGPVPAARAQEDGPPPTPVTVIEAQPTDYTVTARLPGRIKASTVSEVRPQVAGIIRERLFEEGTVIEAGQPLYQIESDTYAAAVAAAQA